MNYRIFTPVFVFLATVFLLFSNGISAGNTARPEYANETYLSFLTKNISVSSGLSAYKGTRVYVLTNTEAWLETSVSPSHLQAEGLKTFSASEDVEIYSEIELEFADKVAIENFLTLDLDLDHFHPELGVNRVLLPKKELQILRDNGISFEVTVDDMAAAIERRNIEYLAKNPISIGDKTTSGFELGSMGGFYTYAEVLAQLDEMKLLYPNLITDKFSIGTTGEGRTIWAVKISDNPDTDESVAEAPVYFDALHHAREPASMATVINFMFHLLENYGSDPGLSYVVDNREIFIVPVVNPDGYEYNRQTNPNGGGLWRKNRRVNPGSSCRGVDINRNYDTDWAGASSSNPCSNSYHGTAPFTEPEAQAIRDFTTSVGAPISYTTHTSGGYWLGPDFSNNRPDFAIHAELMNDCMQENEYIHGDADIILGYVSGTTQGWLYEALGSLTWTPEIGTTGFWPTIPEIIPLVNEQIKPYEYACWVAGALADYQGFTITSSQGLSSAAPLDFDITIKNKGLTRTAQGVNVVVTTDNAGVTAAAGSQSYGNIASRAFATNSSSFSFNVGPSVPAGTVVTFFVEVSQDGVVSDTDAFQLTVGAPTVLFSDDAESGSGAWSNGGSGSTWQTSTEDAYTGNSCFVDSRISHAAGNRNFSTNSAISLAGTVNPQLEFAAKWSMYQKYTRLQISVNGGGWSNLSTSATETVNGGPGFVGNERWTFQVVDLSAYIGQAVRFRFANFGGGTNPDGFYFDDFRVVDYTAPPVCSVTGNIISEVCDGATTVTTTDDTYTITVSATVSNGSGAYDVLANGSEVLANVSSGTSASFTAAAGSPVAINFRDAVDNGCTSTTINSGALNSCSPTCSDGIQNGSETGVDCGGPDCAACPTCSDGIQNGSETGVDCGGPDCAACPTCSDGIQNGSETGVDCGGPDCAACPTCSDGVQNGSETGVDCGGPDCAACITCSDGIQNGSETGVDCGGPDCAACPTCSDGIQNGSETGVDCGGPDCAACPTCSDGIQNGSETGVDCGGPDCAACPTCSDGIQNGSETGVDCGGPDCAACPTCSDGIQNGAETGVDCGGPDCAACPTPSLAFDQGVVSNVSDGWVSVPLTNNYTSMVVVATVVMPNSSTAPVATRIQNANGNSFELRVQTTTGAAAGSYTVHYVVVEEGVYSVAQDGVKMEAVKISSSVTAENNNWAIEARSYQQAYSSPVVVGQVMSFNDADWSTFWASTATSRTNPPSASSFGAGKNVGEDPDNTRAAELIGYIVIEAGSGTIGQTEYSAGLGADNVLGVGNTSTGYPYTLSGLTAASSAVVSAAAMDGNNGGWPVLYGGTPFTSTQLRLAFDEDVANDTERAHTSEQIAYLAFGASAGAGNCSDGIQNGAETGVDCGGPDCAPCPTCSDGVQNGSETGVDCGGPDCAACPTCSDGIQNGSETGVDCGGPDCAACPTCTDGIQNGNETGVDCGGPDCAACVTCSDGIQNGNETGVDCGGPDCAACPTCSDGIQNGSETGVDCGGPDCAACPTCTDGIQNGNETGVDCGGPDCAACVTCSDGIQNGSETGVDCGGPDCAACPTCTDGIQNGSETGIDCGGPDCAACETCTDGIQNGSETGVDCGGPDCAACPTCTDGIQNGNETGVDCGGPDCAACVTCFDGIQNGNETGVDCGGPDCAACVTCSDGIQNGNETGVDCGGPDCAACPVNYCSSSAGSTFYEHIASITIAGVTNTTGDDNGYGDYTGTTAIPMSGTVSLSLTPGFAGSSYNEGWVIWIDYNADGDFTDSGELALQLSGSSTVNGNITVPAGLTGSSRMRIQMRYNAFNGSSCGTYAEGEVEDYTVTFGGGARRLATTATNSFVPLTMAPVIAELSPNPASTNMTVRIPLREVNEATPWRVLDVSGKVVLQGVTSLETLRSGLNIDLRNLSAGMYYFSLNTKEVQTMKRFIVQP